MRTFAKLRISKGLFSGTFNAAVVAGLVGLTQLQAPTLPEPMGDMGDMGAFISTHAFVMTEVPRDLPVTGLDVFMETLPADAVPVIVKRTKKVTKKSHAKLSDGDFSGLSPKWKQGATLVALQKRCDKHQDAFVQDPLLPPLLQKAHAIVETNCDADVVGSAGELGIYQVMPKTCRELGVKGDLRNSKVNAQCTALYRKKACASVEGECQVVFMFASHNRGIAGAKRVDDLYSLEYARKVDCAARALKGQKCA
jgi:hypothetical protein